MELQTLSNSKLFCSSKIPSFCFKHHPVVFGDQHPVVAVSANSDTRWEANSHRRPPLLDTISIILTRRSQAEVTPAVVCSVPVTVVEHEPRGDVLTKHQDVSHSAPR